MLIRIFYLQYPQHNNYLSSSYHLKSQKFEFCKVTSKTACKIRWVLKHYHLRNLFTNGACEPNGMQFFAHRSPSDSRNESCNLLSINSMQIYESEIIFTSKFQTAPPASIRTAFYMQHHFIHSTVSTKQNNTLGVAQQTTYKKRVFYGMIHHESRIGSQLLF